MTQSFWESGAVEDQQTEFDPAMLEQPELNETALEEPVSEQPAHEEPVLEQQPEQVNQEPSPEPLSPPTAESAEPETLALSADEFSALEDRVLRTVILVKRERVARAEAEERAVQAEVQLREQMPLVDQLQTEVKALRTERDQVRQRVERLLSQLDALEL